MNDNFKIDRNEDMGYIQPECDWSMWKNVLSDKLDFRTRLMDKNYP